MIDSALPSHVRLSAGGLRLALDVQRRRHQVGSALSSGPGSSLEFHDYRAYQPGDDLRHLDWGVLGRSDQLFIRRHRQEVAPRCAILLDASASMALTAQKWEMARDLAALLTHLAIEGGARPQLWVVAERWRALAMNHWQAALAQLSPQQGSGLEVPPPAMLAGGQRLLISDGLCPAGAAALVPSLARGAASCLLIEVLTQQELDPSAWGSVELCDAEGERAEVMVDAAACATYRRRLAQHRQGWQKALRGRGPGVVSVLGEAGWPAAIQQLLSQGVVEPRR